MKRFSRPTFFKVCSTDKIVICDVLSRVNKQCQVEFSNDSVSLQSKTLRLGVFTTLRLSNLFHSSKLDSVLNIEVNLKEMSNALKVVGNIAIENGEVSLYSSQMQLMQRLVYKSLSERIKEPQIKEPTCHVIIPLHKFRMVLEKIKSAKARICIEKNQLTVESESEYSSVLCTFLELEHPNQFETAGSVTVYTKDLMKVAQCYACNPIQIVCSIVDREAILFYVYLLSEDDPEVISYFLPATSSMQATP